MRTPPNPRPIERSRAVVAVALAALVVPVGCSAPEEDAGPSTGAPSTSSRPTTPEASSDSPSTPFQSSTKSSTSGTAGRGACTIAAAGDVAGDDFEEGAALTAALISSRRPRAVVAVGDTAYEEGSSDDYADYYDPTWGAFQDITLPVPGNHEYETSGGAGFAEYFGQEALSNRSVDMCGWRLVLVNEYAGMEEAASFITQQAGTRPLVVVWHEPRFSSGDEHGSDPEMQPLWEAAVAAGAAIVLNGHDHDYERFAPLDAEGNPVSGGTTEFVTGLGGHHVRDFSDIEAHSEARFTGTPAVLFLTLRRRGYSWEEQTVDGRVVDAGRATVTPQ